MKKFKHSGTLGDLVYALPIVKAFGGGEFYLHLDQIGWIVKTFYGSTPDPYHQGRMTKEDFVFMQSFMESQSYITKFDVLDNKNTEITHNLDRFRPIFVRHPSNYINVYCDAFNITDPAMRSTICEKAWLTVPNPRPIPARPYVINRTSRGFSPTERNTVWDQLREQGVDQQSVFVGLPAEYQAFKAFSDWNIEYHPVSDMLELAEVIAGCQQFIGNQSVALSIAQGLRVPYKFERRRDLPVERNESYFPEHTNGDYF